MQVLEEIGSLKPRVKYKYHTVTLSLVMYTAAPHAVVRSRRPDRQRHGRRYRRQDRDL